MSNREAPINTLADYMPDGAYPYIIKYLQKHSVHLTITRGRKSVLGDYRHKHNQEHHRISVNGNLNKYAFLITLLHELAHLVTFEKYGPRVKHHGAEWKREYGTILKQFISYRLFPEDIMLVLTRSARNPAASSSAEDDLVRVLRKYNPEKPGFYLLEDLPDSSLFKTEDGTIYRKEYHRRKRILCTLMRTKRQYLFSPVAEVEMVEELGK